MKTVNFSTALFLCLATSSLYTAEQAPKQNYVDLLTITPKANTWANTVVTKASQQEAILMANCVYLWYNMLTCNEFTNSYIHHIIGLTAALRVSTLSGEPYGEIMQVLQSELTNFDALIQYQRLLMQTWKECAQECEKSKNEALLKAVTALDEHITITVQQWYNHSSKPLNRFAGLVHKNLNQALEELQKTSQNCRALSEGKKIKSGQEEIAADNCFSRIGFLEACNNEITSYGLFLAQTASETSSVVDQELHDGPLKVLLSYYTALFKAYQSRYGNNAQIPLTHSPYAKIADFDKNEIPKQLPNPEELWQAHSKKPSA